MQLRRRFGVAIATVALGTVCVLGVAACTPASASATLSPEASALSALGFSPSEVTPAANPSASNAPRAGQSAGPRHPRLRALAIRRFLLGNVEHGEIVVRTKDGDKTIEVQRGKITEISATSMTVQSLDGFSETWTFGQPIHVIEHRTTVQPSNLTVGDEVGVAGTKSGSTDTAKLIVIPNG